MVRQEHRAPSGAGGQLPRQEPKLSKRGEYADLGDLQGPRRELAVVVRKLCSLISGGELGLGGRGPGQREGLSEVCNASRSALSDLLNGKTKRPDLGFLMRLYALAEEKAETASMPLSLEELEQLHKAVMDSNRRQYPCAGCPTAERRSVAAAANGKPADLNLRRPVPDATLPVPPSAGDRQVAAPQEWTGMGDLHARLAAGQDADAVGILRHAGLAVAAPETAAAIAACHRHGLGEAADAMIAYAAQRSERDVMQIARALIENDLPAGARELLGFALAM